MPTPYSFPRSEQGASGLGASCTLCLCLFLMAWQGSNSAYVSGTAQKHGMAQQKHGMAHSASGARHTSSRLSALTRDSSVGSRPMTITEEASKDSRAESCAYCGLLTGMRNWMAGRRRWRLRAQGSA